MDSLGCCVSAADQAGQVCYCWAGKREGMGLSGLPATLGNVCTGPSEDSIALTLQLYRPLVEVDQLQLKSIFKGIRGLTGMFSICAR